MKVTLKKTRKAGGVTHFVGGASYLGAEYDVLVDDCLVGNVRTSGHGSRLRDVKGSPVFYGVDGSRNWSVSVRGIGRKYLEAAAIAAYEKLYPKLKTESDS